MKMILGSKSRSRKAILESMGYTFEVMSADIDEKAYRSDNPMRLTTIIAVQKGLALLPKITEDALLITCDQVVVCNGKILEKPESADEARRNLKNYATYPAKTVTAVVINDTQSKIMTGNTDVAEIWFKPLPENVIEEYVATGDPFEHSGSFAHEHPLISPYVDHIDGEPESVSGLPKKMTQDMIDMLNRLLGR